MFERGPGRGVAHAGQRLVALHRGHELGGVVADVAHVERHGRGEQALHEHVPLLGELRPEVGVEGTHVARGRRARDQLGEAGGDRARAASTCRRRRSTRRRTAGSWGAGGWSPCPPCTGRCRSRRGRPSGRWAATRSRRAAPTRCRRACRARGPRCCRPARRSARRSRCRGEAPRRSSTGGCPSRRGARCRPSAGRGSGSGRAGSGSRPGRRGRSGSGGASRGCRGRRRHGPCSTPGRAGSRRRRSR